MRNFLQWLKPDPGCWVLLFLSSPIILLLLYFYIYETYFPASYLQDRINDSHERIEELQKQFRANEYSYQDTKRDLAIAIAEESKRLKERQKELDWTVVQIGSTPQK